MEQQPNEVNEVRRRRGAGRVRVRMTSDVLIVDDEPEVREAIAAILGDEGYEVRHELTAAPRSRRSTLGRRVMLLDIWLEGSQLDGLEVLDQVRRSHPDVPVIVISGHGTIETAVTAIKKGATTSWRSRSTPSACWC